MKTTQPTHKKLLARVLYISPEVLATARPTKQQVPSQKPTALIQCDTPAQAKQIVRAAEFLRLSHAEQVEKLSFALMLSECGENPLLYAADARAVLRAMGMGGAK